MHTSLGVLRAELRWDATTRPTPPALRVLMFWYIVARLKKLYATYVLKVMGSGLSDTVFFMKNFWMNKCFALLNQIPEV